MLHGMTLAQQVRDARHALGLTQTELANLSGVSPATIHRLESGRTDTRPHVRVALERVLNTTLTREHIDRGGS